MTGGAAPKVSYGLPVRNGAAHIERALTSLLAQDFEDFEIVISDNASDDETPSLCERFARADPRVRLLRNERDIGQVANFNRALECAQGEYFRWIGADDWLEPAYTSKCVEALDRDPSAIAVSTFQDHWRDDGVRRYAEHRGAFVDSPSAPDRFVRMMWFLSAGFVWYDPIYSMFRRSALALTQRLRVIPDMDKALALELSVLGRFIHVSECLAHRRRETGGRMMRYERYHPSAPKSLDVAVWKSCGNFRRIARDAGFPFRQRLRCERAILRYWLNEERRLAKAWWRPRLRRLPGIKFIRATLGKGAKA